jgi:hypothetical protein
MYENDQATDGKRWDQSAISGVMAYRIVNDAYNTSNTWLQVSRTGMSVNYVAFPTANLAIGTTSATARLTGPNTYANGTSITGGSSSVSTLDGFFIDCGVYS